LNTTKPFVPSIWGRLHEKENYTGSGTWISFLHSFLSSNMSSLRPLASISCRIISIHVFFGLPCALLICSNLISSTRRTGVSVGLRCTWPNYRRRFSLILSYHLHTCPFWMKNLVLVISRGVKCKFSTCVFCFPGSRVEGWRLGEGVVEYPPHYMGIFHMWSLGFI